MSKSTQAPTDASGFSESLSAINGQSINFFSEAYSRWVKNASTTTSELLRFVNDRFNKDVQLMTRFGECKKPEEFLALQSEVLTSLIGDYAQEGSKLFGMLSAASEDAYTKFAKATAATKSA